MSFAENELIRRWSTGEVEASKRLDYFAAALSESVAPMGVDAADAKTFRGDLSFAEFGEIRVLKAFGSAHGAFRGKAELARHTEHTFNLLIGLQAPWTAEHRGQVRLMPRDVLLFDSDRPLKTDVRDDFKAINVSMPERWIRRWLPDPGLLTGQRIPGDSLWGLALSSYLGELSPELVAAPPLPLSVIADQVGSLLALTASALRDPVPRPARAARALHKQIEECIAQRCTEHGLTAADVSAAVGISVRTLHRTLAALNDSFGGRLIEARTRIALRMLTSPLFKRVTSEEIGRRAGFLSHSHFARVMRRRTGKTPRQLRKMPSDFTMLS